MHTLIVHLQKDILRHEIHLPPPPAIGDPEGMQSGVRCEHSCGHAARAGSSEQGRAAAIQHKGTKKKRNLPVA